jgi:hypothetical protein
VVATLDEVERGPVAEARADVPFTGNSTCLSSRLRVSATSAYRRGDG